MKNNQEELRPCPFCGKQAEDDTLGMVFCTSAKCSCHGAAYTPIEWDNRQLEDAQAARIAELEARVKELEDETEACYVCPCCLFAFNPKEGDKSSTTLNEGDEDD